MALIHWVTLSLCDGLGPITVRKLIEAFGSAELACEARANELKQVEGIGAVKASKLREALGRAAENAPEEIEKARAAGVQIVCAEDETYPTLLRAIPDPPCVLYVKGELQPRDLNGFAIVGSRKCSYYGREQAERFAAVLAGAGFTVLSGGARGVDSAAHRGAMQHPQGRTIAVLGCGLDVVYPPENKDLFDQITGKGAVVSEYAMGTPPLPENFPRRNRIISGMSRGVLVVEADERSGALVTARQAIEDHNRPVFALPGKVDNPMSAGPHKLIREGATLVTNLAQIIEGLGPLPDHTFEMDQTEEGRATQAAQQPVALGLSDNQTGLMNAMSSDPMSVDQLMEATGLPAHQILQEMTLMSLKGLVKRVDGQTFVRKTFMRN